MEYDKSDVSVCTGINQSGNLSECIICHYGCFLRINFRFQPRLSDGFHDMTQKSMNFIYVAIATVGINDYRIHFLDITKSKTMNKMKNADLSKKSAQLWLWKKSVIIVLSNNTPENITKHRKKKEKCIEEGKQYYK